MVLEDSFVADYMSLSEEDKATVRAVVDAMCASGKVARLGSNFSWHPHPPLKPGAPMAATKGPLHARIGNT